MKCNARISLALAITATLFCASAAPNTSAQQVTGTPGSPSATTSVDGKQIPPPPTKFGGVIKESAKDSTPWWPPRVVPPKGAPNILLIMTDDQGYGVSGTFGGIIPTTASGQTAVASDHYYGSAYGAAYHPPVAVAVAPVPYYRAYHPPVVVNSYSTGCYNCGGWAVAGAVVAGAAAGVAVANANASAANANAAAANANAAAANANAATAGANQNYTMGEIVGAIPAGCAVPVVNGTTYYLCGDTWFTASYGANGVYYRVVPTP